MSAAPAPQTPGTPGSFHEPRHIPQRELRNDSSRILREVEEGAEFIITNRGRPVARLTGLVDVHHSGLAFTPASRPPEFNVEDLVELDISTKELLADLRDERI